VEPIMPETIEAFVEKIRSEGVQAGRKQADQLIADAKNQADEIISQARREKEKIISKAHGEAESILARSKSELALAARDAALRLRDALSAALREVLSRAAKDKLTDTAFIGEILHEIIIQYGKTELAGARALQINVPQEMRQKLADWAIRRMGHEAAGERRAAIDLKGTLAQAGFEYNATGATVEVTLESVVEVLSELVGPSLREVLDRALADKGR
jgi:V/A-type H+-transporting ATPase subunit E